jgi:hypothetical protein
MPGVWRQRFGASSGVSFHVKHGRPQGMWLTERIGLALHRIHENLWVSPAESCCDAVE